MHRRYLLGLLLIIIGGAWLVDQMQLVVGFNFRDVFVHWWPVILVVVGLNEMVRHPSRVWFGLAVFLIGTVLLFNNFQGNNPLDTRVVVLAVALMLIGARLLLPREKKMPVPTPCMRPGPTPTGGETAADVVEQQVSFAEMHLRDVSPQFRGGAVSVSFGSLTLDLRGATLAQEGGALSVSASFGNVEVLVPPTWLVEVSGTANFGEWHNQTQQVPPPVDAPTLRIQCVTNFGEVKVRN
jgi:predicted membrane protein